ncbi:MAG: hypothetical protein ACXWQO_10850, partial [Bdellovibrionota bacterium]
RKIASIEDKDLDRVKGLVCELNISPRCPALSVTKLSSPPFVLLDALAKKYKERGWPAFSPEKASEAYREFTECDQQFASTTPACLADAISESR